MKALPLDVSYLRLRLRSDSERGLLFWRYLPGGDAPWNAKMAGRQVGALTDNGYLGFKLQNRHYLNHRVVWALTHNCVDFSMLDHVNGDKTDNRIANLRLATANQNRFNTGKTKLSLSGYKGVCFDKVTGKWQAGMGINYGKIYLGQYDKLEDAVAAYREAAVKLHGEFLRLD